MKAMLSAIAAIAVIGVGAWYGLHQLGFTSQEVNTVPGARVN